MERQAIDRGAWCADILHLFISDTANRIGQTREVNVFRLMATGTIEESVLSIQARKSQLIREAWKDMTGQCLGLLQSRRFPTQKLLPKHASALDLDSH